ncbi:GNAT family N-acetyltransferase [Desulfocurvus sp. DL9XJH121]
MRKLVVLPEEGDPYADEVVCARERLNGDVPVVSLQDLTVGRLEKEGTEVVISAGLPRQWYFTLKGMDVVTVTLGERERFYELSDIVIDCRNDNPKRYFVSSEHTVCNNQDFNFENIANLIRKLDWDSEFFGFNVAFVSCMHLTETIVRRIERFIRREDIRLVEYQCNCHDARSVRVAEDNGYRFTDIRLTYERSLNGHEPVELPAGVTFARAGEADIPRLREIARGLYEDSRYIFDRNFDPVRIDEFYQGWVAKGVRGQYDDECWCLYDQDVPFAFCTLSYLKENTANIGLVGLDQGHQGGGHGGRLMRSVFNALVVQGVKSVRVVTQGRNYGAQNLYQSVGFRTRITQLWYHKWL